MVYKKCQKKSSKIGNCQCFFLNNRPPQMGQNVEPCGRIVFVLTGTRIACPLEQTYSLCQHTYRTHALTRHSLRLYSCLSGGDSSMPMPLSQNLLRLTSNVVRSSPGVWGNLNASDGGTWFSRSLCMNAMGTQLIARLLWLSNMSRIADINTCTSSSFS